MVGVSTGGVSALKFLLGALSVDFPVPVLVVTHITPDADDGLAMLLNTLCAIRVKEADELDVLLPGTVYLAPANYHLLVEKCGCLALSIDPPVNFARPSVDVLFVSAAEAFGPELVGIILTGAGNDGSSGLRKIKNCGGVAIVQDPADAEMDAMPKNALSMVTPDYIIRLSELPDLLVNLVSGQSSQ
ncbi:MAG: chemotaxis protein CheB [Desulfuromonadaceae bacterium]|nr:chemotaxis protein CheB [Desulfuromonadaceae bacterium]MDD5106204.1 chemotaxis protein CheB [Desulfuromonadaceae bacterium]